MEDSIVNTEGELINEPVEDPKTSKSNCKVSVMFKKITTKQNAGQAENQLC
jgi:hypothetical protein